MHGEERGRNNDEYIITYVDRNCRFPNYARYTWLLSVNLSPLNNSRMPIQGKLPTLTEPSWVSTPRSKAREQIMTMAMEATEPRLVMVPVVVLVEFWDTCLARFCFSSRCFFFLLGTLIVPFFFGAFLAVLEEF